MKRRIVEDSKVFQVWRGVGEDGEEIIINPSLYNDIGFPVDDNGDPFEYIRTEIVSNGVSTIIEKIKDMATDFYGHDEIIFVGIKYQENIGWVAKIKLKNHLSLVETSYSSSEKALRKLKKRLTKIIDRYNMV